MWKVDIYLEADSKAQKNTERKCAYILETICAGAIKTAEGFQCISGTYHSATLQNLVAALSRIRKTSNVCVHTEDVMWSPVSGNFRKWQQPIGKMPEAPGLGTQNSGKGSGS